MNNNAKLTCFEMRWIYGKIIIISFDDEEEKALNHVLGLLEEQKFEVIEHNDKTLVSSSNMKLYIREHRIEVGNKSLSLGRKQFALLLLLVRNPKRFFTKEELYAYVWKEVITINVEETIQYHISDIRKKLKEIAGSDYIETVWGIGYRFRSAE